MSPTTLPTPGVSTGWGATLNTVLNEKMNITEAPLNITRYGAVADGGTTNNLTAFTSAFAALPATGGQIFIPRAANNYGVVGSLNPPNGTTFVGEGANGSHISQIGGSAPLFSFTAVKRDMVFDGLTLSSSGGHVFELGATGGLQNSAFDNCLFVAYANGVSMFHQNGTGDFIWVRFRNCDFTRFVGATVPGFDMRNTNGAFNGNSWVRCRVTSSNGTAGGPFWKIIADLASSYAYDNEWKSIIAEQNKSGLIQIDSANGATFENVTDYDVSGAYTASLIKVGKGLGGYPTGIKLSNVGNRGGTMDGSTVFQFEATAALATPPILDRVWDASRKTLVKILGGSGVTVFNPSGVSGSLTQSTASKTLDPTVDGTVIFNGTSLTCTLPDPTQLIPGYSFTVKNINASALTVTSGVTIDGAGTKSLAQWAVATYASDGVRYLQIG